MKVLWICNVPIPEAQEVMGDETKVKVSWLIGISKALRKRVDLYIGYTSFGRSEIAVGKGDHVTFVAIPRRVAKDEAYDPDLENEIARVYDRIRPDVIHVFGTEFPHTYSTVCASKKKGCLDRTVISIQGLVSIYAKHYVASLPEWVQHFYTLRDVLKRNNIRGARNTFKKRGVYEIKALQEAKHVIGRTDWDDACTRLYNPDIRYHFNNEILRDSFYENEWSYENCKPHRIFMSQGGFPYKGFHFMVEALAIIKKAYPDVSLYITERDFLHPQTFKDRIRLNSYQYYIRKLIRKYDLEDHIHFLGMCDEAQMCEQYLKANVFVLPSAIENSPNSLGEAMILGTPVVVSDVGGVKNMITHEKEGFVFQHDAPYMIAYYVQKYFKMQGEAAKISKQASLHAKEIFDRTKNIDDLVAIYEELSQK